MKLKLSIVVSGLFLCSAGAFANPYGEKVNCREVVVGSKNIYGGAVSCIANYEYFTCVPKGSSNIITKHQPKEVLTGYVGETTKSTYYLSKLVTYNTNEGAGPGMCTIPRVVSKEISCIADIPYLETRPVSETVCDYKPEAWVSVSYVDAEVNAWVSAEGRDYDGQVVNRELWVNGVLQNTLVMDLATLGGAGTTFNVKAVAVDDDGYRTERSRNVTVKDMPRAMCGKHPC